jgi:hypothetical protein
LLASASSLTAHAQAFDLKALMQRMAQRKSGEARFTEERIVSGIDSPLRSQRHAVASRRPTALHARRCSR